MRHAENIATVGEPGSGKSENLARSMVKSEGAEIVMTPHNDDLCRKVLPWADHAWVYINFSILAHSIGLELLSIDSQDPLVNDRRVEAFTKILLRLRDLDSMAGTPLMQEWVSAAVQLLLHRRVKRPVYWLVYAFMPETQEFDLLLKGCTCREVVKKFTGIKGLTPKALRAEVGSAARLINVACKNAAFKAWTRGGFDLGQFLEGRGKMLVEPGPNVGPETMRLLMSAIFLLAIEYAKNRERDWPVVFIRIDEAPNGGLCTNTERQAAAEWNKKGFFFEFLFNREPQGGFDELFQVCPCLKVFRIADHTLARKMAVRLVSGGSGGEESKAQQVDDMTRVIQTLKPGHHKIRDRDGTRDGYEALLGNPWPDWGNERQKRYVEKIQWLYTHPAYQTGGDDDTASDSGSAPESPPPTKSPSSSSPATRLKKKRRANWRAGGSANNERDSGAE